MQLHQLTAKTKRSGSKRVGRGNASGKGKTSGRGTKGQKARAGHSIRPDVREKLKKLPKLRGRGINGLTSIETKPTVINLAALESAFKAGDQVTPALLVERGMVRVRKGASAVVKILGDGELTKKLAISGCTISAAARAKIEKVGGSVN